MGDGMFDDDAALRRPPDSAGERTPLQAYGTIVVVGGGCYGSYYVRQLRRALRAAAVAWERLVVVDRDPHCRVIREQMGGGSAAAAARTPEEEVEVVAATWEVFFRDYLARACADPAAASRDAIVPSPLMPHLMSDWLRARARERWPQRTIDIVPLPRQPSIPWQRASPEGTHYVSFAEWICPVNCVEPALCPEIRGPRTWSMPPAIRAYVDAERARGEPIEGPLLFHCTHRVYGVGMFDTCDVIAADREMREAGTRAPVRVLVGTVSHCHGALDLLSIGAGAA